MTDNRCRLCAGEAIARFEHVVLDRHRVAYWRCQTCASLQTDVPFWLDEAYARPSTDTGRVVRCMLNLGLIVMLSRIGIISRIAPLLDFGGGVGLLARLLRDSSFDAWNSDAYSKNELAS